MTCVENPRDLRALSAKYITDTSFVTESGHGEREEEEVADREVRSGEGPVGRLLAGREREPEIEVVPGRRYGF